MSSIVNTVQDYAKFMRNDYIPTIERSDFVKQLKYAYNNEPEARKGMQAFSAIVSLIALAALYFNPIITITTLATFVIVNSIVLFSEQQDKHQVQIVAERAMNKGAEIIEKGKAFVQRGKDWFEGNESK